MSRTYQTCAIILKTSAMGEADRLLTLLSPEHGLFKAIAPGARKPKSKLGGRTAMFVVNDLLLVKGRSLDKLIQADVRVSYPGLSRDLAKLTTGQYWAELTLAQGLAEQPQSDLFQTITTLLHALETALLDQVSMLLVGGIYQLLNLAGITPQLKYCGLSQRPLPADLAQISSGLYFSYEAGGTVMGEMLQMLQNLDASQSFESLRSFSDRTSPDRAFPNQAPYNTASELKTAYVNRRSTKLSTPKFVRLTAQDYHILCYLDQWASQPIRDLSEAQEVASEMMPSLTLRDWLSVEKILRGYALHYFDRPIKSANLIESAFPLPPSSRA